MSPAKAGQVLPVTDPGSQPMQDVEALLRTPGHAGISIGGMTLRWVRDCWSVGRWQNCTDRPRWKDATWHGQLDQALRRLLERCIGGEVHDLADVVERVERAYREISQALGEVVRNGRPE